MGMTYLVATSSLEERWKQVLADSGFQIVPDLRGLSERMADAGAQDLSALLDSKSTDDPTSRVFCISDSNVKIAVYCDWNSEINRHTFGIGSVTRKDARSGRSRSLIRQVELVLRRNGAEDYDPY